jgi:polyferredoxin
MHLDPLMVLANVLSSRLWLATFSLVLVTILLTFVFGRAWCGWICPLGTLLDLFHLRKRDSYPENRPSEAWRRVKYTLLIAILISALLGNLTLLIFDPLAILFRTLTTSIWPALDQFVTAVEMGLYQIPWFAGPVSSFDSLVRPALLPSEPIGYRLAIFYAVFFVALIAFNLIAPRFWCRYLCPLGALLGLISKLALFRREVSEECKGCTLCTQVCPTGTIDPNKNYASDPSECTMCLDCLEVCPRSTIAFTPRYSPAAWQDYDPGRRQALVTFGLTIAALAVLSSDNPLKRQRSKELLPPGAHGDDFFEKCLRCTACMRACPTSALQPSFVESGLESLWTPVVIPRLGYCDYSCNRCGQVCPVEAIPPIGIEEKRLQIIGKAYIDQNRCIAWADRQDCIVCEEMCPLPNKAIRLEPGQPETASSTQAAVLLPYVDRDLCIGCGICEYKCPVSGQAAIQVFVANSVEPL